MLGVFDSGVGGLTVLKHVHVAMPDVSTLYFGDNAHAPFGTKTHEEILAYTWEAVEWLFQQGCPLVLLACNSASAQALREIQQTKLAAYPGRRVLGVIRPTVEEMDRAGYKRVGIFATNATVSSKTYINEFHDVDARMEIAQHACPTWVDIVERGEVGTIRANRDIAENVNALLKQAPHLDAVLLGCTHYPALFDRIRRILPEGIDLLEQGPLVAQSLRSYLDRHPEIADRLLRSHARRYVTSGDPTIVTRAAQQIAGVHVEFERVDLSPILG